MKSLEQRTLQRIDNQLELTARQLQPGTSLTDARLTILEYISSLFGGWNFDVLQPIFDCKSIELPLSIRRQAKNLAEEIRKLQINPALALSALSREPLSPSETRSRGAYYTDWRLAEMLAEQSAPEADPSLPWIDPSCGTGILLAAAASAKEAGTEREMIIKESLVGADLSSNALRGTRLAVGSLTRNIETLEAFTSRLLLQDSLQSLKAWSKVAPNGAGLVIGNPPWEKLKVSRHETAKRRGSKRTYGSDFKTELDLSKDREELISYIESIVADTRFQGGGEHDLYKLFLELSLGLVATNGIVSLLLPAGLIRSQGTEALRRELLNATEELSISILENRAAHFAIDTRFKFIHVVGKVGTKAPKPIKLKVADRNGRLPAMSVKLDRSEISSCRPDLTIPEVRTGREWELFRRLATESDKIGEESGPWNPSYCREVDMSRDRPNFTRDPSPGFLPLLEGRHITQYRWRAKRYMGGQGRSSKWKAEGLNTASLTTQWFVNPDKVRPNARDRVFRSRIGFCDIAGQTNERTLMVARIPQDVICGNKVPTLRFPQDEAEREDLFLALSNSLVVDWMMRRTVTTTINYFVLDGLPLPKIDPHSEFGMALVTLARRITESEGNPNANLQQVAMARARIDAMVASAWSLTVEEMQIVLSDFPLLDRGQPPIPGEDRSTVTVDLVLSELAKINNEPDPFSNRFIKASKAGARAYIPAEYSKEP